MSYASRLQRLSAWLIELVVVSVLLALGLILGGGSYFAGFVIAMTAIWLYFAGFESSSLQSTLSGRILGLRVTDLSGADQLQPGDHAALRDVLHRADTVRDRVPDGVLDEAPPDTARLRVEHPRGEEALT